MTSQTCYSYHRGQINVAGPSVPCGITNSTVPNVPCCVAGDTCMSDGICMYTHSLANGTGYYVADCTDPTFNAGNCRRACDDQNLADIVYKSNDVWACCAYRDGGFIPDCANPSNEQFNAPAPSALLRVQSIPSSGVPTYATAAPTSSTSSSSIGGPTTATLTASSTAAASSGLSTGAQAGIGVGVALAVLALIGLAGFLFMRRRRDAKSAATTSPREERYGEMSGAPYGSPDEAYRSEQKYAPVGYQDEPASTAGPVELRADQETRELGGNPLPSYKQPYGGTSHELAS